MFSTNLVYSFTLRVTGTFTLRVTGIFCLFTLRVTGILTLQVTGIISTSNGYKPLRVTGIKIEFQAKLFLNPCRGYNYFRQKFATQ